MLRKCVKCGDEKETSDFSPHHKSKDGFRLRCKLCCHEKNMAKYDEPEDYILKTCTMCGQSKQAREFHKMAATKDGRCPSCKKCCEEARKTVENATYRADRGHNQHAPIAEKSNVDQSTLLTVQLKREQLDLLDHALEKLNESRLPGDTLARADIMRYAMEKYLKEAFY